MHWLTHLRRSLWARRLLGALVVGAAIALLPLPASGGGRWWDIGIGVGYAALIGITTLYLYPLRGAGLPHRRLLTLSQHRRTGWIVLALAGLHTALLLVAEPLSSRYLLPSAPLYMLSGIAALIALAVLVPTGLSARAALRKTPASAAQPATSRAPDTPPPHQTPQPRRASSLSVTAHACLAALILALIAAHIVGSHQLIDTRVKTVTLCLLLAIPLAWATLRSGTHGSVVVRARLARIGAWRADWLPAIAALALLPAPTARTSLMEPAVTTPPTLQIHFPHDKHTTVNCVTCHHNFVDRTGVGSCLDCHRRPRPDLTQSAEATFHTFCRDCHTRLATTTAKHGPTRSCSACHLKPAATG